MKHGFRRIMALVMSLCLLCGLVPLTAFAATISPIEADNFTILWATDPQWYSFAYPEVLTVQNDWVVNNANRMNILYTVHTGDFVDNPHSHEQWAVANKEYKKWDDAGMAYGVLAGNHDVDTTSGTTDHTEFSQYFGEARYKDNWWYGGSYENNYGHYDLMNLGGVEFIFVYLGYGPHTEADYAWMNTVLKQYDDRIAVLAFHEYMAASGERTSRGNTIFENVVLKNPNVRMVLCGHNYNSTRKVDTIDDNGDGKADRTVYQMMANYQNTTKGGNGFMRFMECDVAAGTITHRTYSPYTEAFGSDYEDGTILDEYGKRDEFTIPFDFSAPKAKEAGDPASGSVVNQPQAAFAPVDGAQTLAFPVAYVNRAETGNTYHGVGVYDARFSLNAADAFSSPRALNYVVTKYQNGAHTVQKVIRGAWMGEDTSVPVPQDGVVIAIPENTMDVGVLGVGHKVFLKNISGLHVTSPSSIRLTVPSLDVSYNIDATNRVTGNGEWVIYDGSKNDTSSHTWDMLFTFAPLGGASYQLTTANTTLGAVKTVSVPNGGLVLSVNAANTLAPFADAVRAFFKNGLQVTLEGHVPGASLSADVKSFLPSSVGGWTPETSEVVIEQQGNAHVLYKTAGSWPSADHVFSTPITVDPADMMFCYDYMIESGGQASIVLHFKDSTPANAVSGQKMTLQSYFEGATISANSGDVKGDGVRRTGVVKLGDMAIPSTAFNDDGTVTITGLRVMLSGSNVNKKIEFYNLGVSNLVDESLVSQSMPMTAAEITVANPSKQGGYVYDNGRLTVTSDEASGYEVVVTLNRAYDVTTLKNMILDVQSTTAFDIQPVFTTSGEDTSYGLVSDFWPQFCDATVNNKIPAGSYQKALNVYSCFEWNGTLPANGITTVRKVRIQLDGKGTLTLNALQASNGTTLAQFEDGIYQSLKTPNVFLESDVYEVGDTYLTNVSADTTVQTLLQNLRSTQAVTVLRNGAAVNESALVCTGMIVKAGDAIARTVVVRGDVNGDGKASTVDGRTIVLAVLKVASLNEAQILAADFDESGEMNTTDVRELLKASING